jgi:hypothetical protein
MLYVHCNTRQNGRSRFIINTTTLFLITIYLITIISLETKAIFIITMIFFFICVVITILLNHPSS